MAGLRMVAPQSHWSGSSCLKTDTKNVSIFFTHHIQKIAKCLISLGGMKSALFHFINNLKEAVTCSQVFTSWCALH